MDRVETTNVDLSNTALIVDEIVEFGRHEVEALARMDVADNQVLPDLHARLAFMALHDTTARENRRNLRIHMQGASEHPLGPALMMSLGIAKNSEDLLEAARESTQAALTGDARGRMLRELVETWLYRMGDPLQAMDIARELAGAEMAPEITRDLQYLYMIALGAAGEWGEVAAALTESALAPDAGIYTVAEAIHVIFDRLDDVDNAAALIVRVAERLIGGVSLDGPDAIHHYRALFLALEVAFALDDISVLDPVALYRTMLGVLDEADGAGRAANAVRFLLAESVGQGEEATKLLSELLSSRSQKNDWGPTLAALTQCQLAGASGDWTRFVVALRSMAEGGDAGAFTGAYVWRASEVADARMDRLPETVRLWRAVLSESPHGDESRRAIERLLLTENPVILIGHLKALSGSERDRAWSLRRAAAVAESRANNLDQAVALLTLALESHNDLATYQHLMRLYRHKQDREALIGILGTVVDRADDLRVSSVYQCLLGALQLEAGDPESAEGSFLTAARQAPLDAVSRVALCGLYRVQRRTEDLIATLTELGTLANHSGYRARFLRELGLLQARELEDRDSARASLQSALELEPGHPATLHALAVLHDHAGEWEPALSLRREAIERIGTASDNDIADIDRLTIYMEIGDIEENQLGNDDAALRAYEDAFGEDDTSIESLHAQARILRKKKKTGPLLDVLRAERQLNPGRARQLEIQLEIAELVSDGARDSDASLNAYLEVLQVDSGNQSALDGLLRLGRDQARWDVIAQAYGNAPRTPATLEVLNEAYRKLGDWKAFAATLKTQLEQADDNQAKAALALELAGVYDRKLGRVDDAIAAHKMLVELESATPESRRELARLLDAAGRYGELSEIYAEELADVPADDVERRLDLLMLLGGLRHKQLSLPEEAITSYESVLALEPEHIGALEALADLFTELKRDKDLLRILELRAATTEDAVERCSIMKRTAEIAERRNDLDGAVVAYQRAFESHPADRTVFTAMEKLCYKNERWDDAMWLYQKAIDLVEAGQCRAYRLGDLYARRGQVQLQYLKDLEAASESYERVIELDAQNDTALKFLESIHSQTGNWARLIAIYEKRAGLLSDVARSRESLRRAARVAGNKLKDPVEAARIYELLLETDSTDDEALNTLERFYERSQNWERLVGVLTRRLQSAAAGDKTTALLRRIAKICEEGLRDSKRAIEHYRRILDIAPGNKESLDALARIFESTEQWSEFIDTVRKQIRVTSDRHVKALLYFKCGSVMEAKFNKEEDAIRYYDAAIKTSPSCLPAVHGLRDLYLRREDWPRVIQTLELEVKLWQDEKERAGVFAQIGRIYANNLKQPDRALHYYESALAVDPDCVPANKSLFEYHFDRGEWARAQKLVQKLAQKVMREGDPTARSDFYRKCGIVSRMTGDPRSGAETMIVALEIKPTNLAALDALVDLAKSHPDAYDDWDSILRELEKLYRKRDDSDAHLARVRVAQAVMLERDGDLEEAEKLYSQATDMCPEDLAIMSALIKLHLDMRNWTHAHDAINRFIHHEPRPEREVMVQALMQQAEIYADYQMDTKKAIATLRKVITLRSEHQEAHYRMAQEHFLLGQFPEARKSIDRVIELAAAPGMPLSPQALARYYYYRGRIIESSGDGRAATSQYRRAVEYDPGYSPPALALARRSADAGDQTQAENLLINAAHAAMEQGGAKAAVPLQRGLARILLGSGDRGAAIEAYRGILNVMPDSPMDRVALAEIYAVEDVPKAISELRKVINRDIYHAPAYRMLAGLHSRMGDNRRAWRSLTVMDMLGFAEDVDRAAAEAARLEYAHRPLVRQLDEALRRQLMVTDAANGPLGEIFNEIAVELSNVFPAQALGDQHQLFKAAADKKLLAVKEHLTQFFGIEPEVYVGNNVPGAVAVTSFPRPIAVFDRSLLTENEDAWQYLFGWAFESIRGGYAMLYSLSRRQRREFGALMRSLLLPEANRAKPTLEFMRTLSPRAIQTIERYAGQIMDPDTDSWIENMTAMAKRGGLLACDAFGIAVRMNARLSGDNPASDDDIVALGSVLGGADLVRFYLSDEYDKLRELLTVKVGGATS